MNSETSAGLLYDVARLDTLVGDRDGACRTLTSCFEQIQPSQLAKVKGFVEKCPDFKTLHDLPAYAEALGVSRRPRSLPVRFDAVGRHGIANVDIRRTVN